MIPVSCSSPHLFLFSEGKKRRRRMPPSGLLLRPLSASSLVRPSNRTQFDFYPSTKRRRGFLYKSFRCKASLSSFSVTDFDLYDLLGIDSTSDQAQIKTAYRSLQKRCHPDIAGPSGHEMAIILNDVYSILSDPVSRSAYDKEQAKMAEFEGYSGKPLYSKWFGSESEERAVFVDEIKCVGCLKCALLAEKTFAIESVYGRARVVAQWADPEDKILDAMQACPVDCISMVERSNLAALEYLMSKQPRGNARTSQGKGMVDVKKFQSKLEAAKNKESIQGSREAAFHAIRSMSNWFYWQPPKGGNNSLIHIGESKSRFDTSKLHEAAAAARQGFWSSRNATRTYSNNYSTDDMEYYWTPMDIPYEPQVSVMDDSNVNKTTTKFTRTASTRSEVRKRDYDGDPRNPWGLTSVFPMATAILAAVIVKLQGAEGLSNGGYDAGLQQGIAAGPLPLEIVNSSWLQIILAGFTWYLIGSAVISLGKAITNRQKIERKQDRW